MATASITVEVKKKRYLVKFTVKWIKTYKNILKSRKGENMPFCEYHSSDFSIGLEEETMLLKRITTLRHKNNVNIGRPCGLTI